MSSDSKSGEKTAETELDKLKKNFKVFQGEYRVKNYKTHYFMILELLRQVIRSILLATFEPWPLAQTILILITNIFFLFATLDHPSLQKFEIIHSELRLRDIANFCWVRLSFASSA